MSKPHGTKEFWLAGLRAEGAALRAAVGQEGALDRPVPTCPGWTATDLVRHVGGIYTWVRSHAGRGVTDPPARRPEGGDLSGDALLAWWDEELPALVRMLEALDPELPAWNWAPRAKKAGFWHRRMAHETAVHRWDGQSAVGLTEPIEAKLAADGVGEVLDTWLPASRRLGPADRTGIVALRSLDTEQIWHLRLRGTGVALLDTDTILDDQTHGPERTVAVGTASDLLLSLYGRVSFEVLEIAGDPTLLEALRVG
jgi:uncharacterized protein (TIGR03083 family)